MIANYLQDGFLPPKFFEALSNTVKNTGIDAKKEFLPMQPNDVETTYADVSDLKNDFGYWPKTTVQEGIAKFVKWYLLYNQTGLGVFR